MQLPNFHRAIVAPEKLRDYLLNPQHRRGAGKARLLMTFGYRAENWQQLESDLRAQHLNLDVATVSDNEYGRRFEIIGPIRTPTGRSVIFVSIWQIDIGTNDPRLITMYPR